MYNDLCIWWEHWDLTPCTNNITNLIWHSVLSSKSWDLDWKIFFVIPNKFYLNLLKMVIFYLFKKSWNVDFCWYFFGSGKNISFDLKIFWFWPNFAENRSKIFVLTNFFCKNAENRSKFFVLTRDRNKIRIRYLFVNSNNLAQKAYVVLEQLVEKSLNCSLASRFARRILLKKLPRFAVNYPKIILVFKWDFWAPQAKIFEKIT